MVFAPEIIRMLGGNTEKLHCFVEELSDGSWAVCAYSRESMLNRPEIIRSKPMHLLRFNVNISTDGITAYEQVIDTQGAVKSTQLSIDPIWKYLHHCKVVAEEPPTNVLHIK